MSGDQKSGRHKKLPEVSVVSAPSAGRKRSRESLPWKTIDDELIEHTEDRASISGSSSGNSSGSTGSTGGSSTSNSSSSESTSTSEGQARIMMSAAPEEPDENDEKDDTDSLIQREEQAFLARLLDTGTIWSRVVGNSIRSTSYDSPHSSSTESDMTGFTANSGAIALPSDTDVVPDTSDALIPDSRSESPGNIFADSGDATDTPLSPPPRPPLDSDELPPVSPPPKINPAEIGGFLAFLAQMQELTQQPVDEAIREVVPDTETVQVNNEDDDKKFNPLLRQKSGRSLRGSNRGDSMLWQFSFPENSSSNNSLLADPDDKSALDFGDIPLSYSPSVGMQPWGAGTSDLWTSTTRLMAAIPEEVASVISTASISISHLITGRPDSVGGNPRRTKEKRICLAVVVLTLSLAAIGVVFIVLAIASPDTKSLMQLAPTVAPTLQESRMPVFIPIEMESLPPSRSPSPSTTQAPVFIPIEMESLPPSRSPSPSTTEAPSIDPLPSGFVEPSLAPSLVSAPTAEKPFVDPSISIVPSTEKVTVSDQPSFAPSFDSTPIVVTDAPTMEKVTVSDQPSFAPSLFDSSPIVVTDAPTTGSPLPTISFPTTPTISFPTVPPSISPDAEITDSPSITEFPTTVSPSISPDAEVTDQPTEQEIRWESYGQIGGDASYRSVRISDSGTRVLIATSSRVQVFELREDGDWQQLGQSIEMPGISAVSISGDGNTLAHGAFFNSDSSSLVTIYRWNRREWVRLGSDLPGSCAFAGSLELSNNGNVAAIGSPLRNFYAGFAEVVEYNEARGEWQRQGDLIQGQESDVLCGASVSLSSDGSVMAMGCPGTTIDGKLNAGRASVFQYHPTFGWTKVGQSLDGFFRLAQFGFSISLSGNGSRVAIGAPFVDPQGSLISRVYVYEVSLSDLMWYPLGDVIEGLYLADMSGQSISLSSDGLTLAIGAPRRRYVQVVVYQSAEGYWMQIGVLDSEQDQFGSSVALSSNGRAGAGCGVNSFENSTVLLFRRADNLLMRRNCHRRYGKMKDAFTPDC